MFSILNWMGTCPRVIEFSRSTAGVASKVLVIHHDSWIRSGWRRCARLTHGEGLTGRSAAVALIVRPMRVEEVGVVIEYFHQASAEHLEKLGVQTTRLPEPSKWRQFYEMEFQLPIEQRRTFMVLWQIFRVAAWLSTAGLRPCFSATRLQDLDQWLTADWVDGSKIQAGLPTTIVAFPQEYFLPGSRPPAGSRRSRQHAPRRAAARSRTPDGEHIEKRLRIRSEHIAGAFTQQSS